MRDPNSFSFTCIYIGSLVSFFYKMHLPKTKRSPSVILLLIWLLEISSLANTFNSSLLTISLSYEELKTKGYEGIEGDLICFYPLNYYGGGRLSG